MPNHIAIHVVNLQPLKENDIDVHPSFKVQREIGSFEIPDNLIIRNKI